MTLRKLMLNLILLPALYPSSSHATPPSPMNCTELRRIAGHLVRPAMVETDLTSFSGARLFPGEGPFLRRMNQNGMFLSDPRNVERIRQALCTPAAQRALDRLANCFVNKLRSMSANTGRYCYEFRDCIDLGTGSDPRQRIFAELIQRAGRGNRTDLVRLLDDGGFEALLRSMGRNDEGSFFETGELSEFDEMNDESRGRAHFGDERVRLSNTIRDAFNNPDDPSGCNPPGDGSGGAPASAATLATDDGTGAPAPEVNRISRARDGAGSPAAASPVQSWIDATRAATRIPVTGVPGVPVVSPVLVPALGR